MRNLINFLIQYSVLILFLVLEMVSIGLIVSNQEYQKSVFLSSSNSAVASMYEVSNSVVEFFKLKAANETLSEENTRLKNEVMLLRNQASAFKPEIKDSIRFHIPPEMEYNFISAKVINSSTNKLQNYITLNKGLRDGIKVDMGVISDLGVVGIVKTVSEKFAVVIPILNDKIKINCKFTKSNYSGPLQWTGVDYRYASLNDIARHVKFSVGDSLVTSGFTNTFPEGIPVGRIENFKINEGDAYYNIKVKLSVDFRTLSHVKVINYKNYREQRYLEQVATEK
ncbi:MAG: rod shape-determining protein MreC [Paludibacter sp.]|nr:rod shape-determining protein MreC [Paludibacter sp.]